MRTLEVAYVEEDFDMVTEEECRAADGCTEVAAGPGS
jgi:hypothetical protein